MILKNTEMIIFWGGKYITQKFKKKKFQTKILQIMQGQLCYMF